MGLPQFDMFRLSKSKQVVDVCPNTLRAYNREGLPFYNQGKAVFVSKSELDAFIRRKIEFPPARQLTDKSIKERSLDWGFLYIMRDSNSRYKIGITNNPSARLYSLKTANPDIHLVGVVFCKHPEKLEAHWHKTFKEKRYEREWFDLDEREARNILDSTATLQIT